MLEIISTILPVFLVMAVGYGAVKFSYINDEVADNLNALSVKLAIPILLFYAIYKLDFNKALQWPVLASFYAGAVVSFVVAVFFANWVFNRRPGEAVAVGFGAMYSNTVLLGIPIAERAFGPDILPLVFSIIAFHTPGLYTIGMISMEFARSDGRKLGTTLKVVARSIFANPIMIGILAGAFFNQLSIPLPVPLEEAVAMVSKAAIPLALIGIGAALTRYKLNSGLAETAMVSVITLIVHPAIAFVLSYYVLGLEMQYVQAAVIIAAMPPGVNIYIFALMYHRAVALSASTIIVATIASTLSISAWLWVLSHL